MSTLVVAFFRNDYKSMRDISKNAKRTRFQNYLPAWEELYFSHVDKISATMALDIFKVFRPCGVKGVLKKKLF